MRESPRHSVQKLALCRRTASTPTTDVAPSGAGFVVVAMPITEEEFERSAQHVQQDLHQIRANVSAFSKLASRVSTDNMVLRRSMYRQSDAVRTLHRELMSL